MVWIVIALLVIIIFLIILLRMERVLRVLSKSEKRQDPDGDTDEVSGISDYGAEQQTAKEENKEKILALFEKDQELNNEQIREVLNISERSVVRYMDELEKSGRIRQIGKTGRNVVYQKTP